MEKNWQKNHKHKGCFIWLLTLKVWQNIKRENHLTMGIVYTCHDPVTEFIMNIIMNLFRID